MSSSNSEKDPPAPPSYTESTSSPIHQNHPTTPLGQSLLDRLTLTRTTHIQSTITTHILPIISLRATLGIATTTIALLPSDIPLPPVPEKSEFSFTAYDHGATKPVEVIGFASEEEPKVVRLEGELNRTEFWRVQVVIGELERVLGGMLNEDRQIYVPRSEFDTPSAGARTTKGSRRALLGRFVPSLGPEKKSPGGNPEVGVREAEGRVSEEGGGRVAVKARLEELCLRTVNEFGLYDTLARQCVIVRVNARC